MPHPSDYSWVCELCGRRTVPTDPPVPLEHNANCPLHPANAQEG